MKQEQKESKNLRKSAILPIAVLVSVVLIGFVFAKYIYTGIRESSQTTAPKFYFTADLLGDTEMVNAMGSTSNVYVFGPESTEGSWHVYGGNEHDLIINLQNYYDELRITQSALNFTAAVETVIPEGSTAGYAASNVTVTPQSGMLSGGTQKNQQVQVSIPSYDASSYEDGTVVTVTVSSLAPYEKSLVFHFVLYKSAPKLSYRVIDNAKSPYAELQLLVGEIGGESIAPTLIWPETLSIDNANPLTFKIVDGEIRQQDGMAARNMEISQPLLNRESESIYFFKNDTTANYTCPITVVFADVDNKYTIDLNTILPADTESAGAGE